MVRNVCRLVCGTTSKVQVTAPVTGIAGCGAVGFGLSGSSSYNSARNELMDQARRDSLYSEANTKRHVALGMAASGLACGGVAAWLYFTGRAAENRSISVNSARVDVVPVVGAAMGLAIMGGF